MVNRSIQHCIQRTRNQPHRLFNLDERIIDFVQLFRSRLISIVKRGTGRGEEGRRGRSWYTPFDRTRAHSRLVAAVRQLRATI